MYFATPDGGSAQTLYERYNKDGLEILAFPSNEFGAQVRTSCAWLAAQPNKPAVSGRCSQAALSEAHAEGWCGGRR